jgi:hypothetical protein
MAVSTANRKMFDHGDAEVTVFGNTVENWKKIAYEKSQESQVNHGRGNDVIGYSEGKITYTCSWTLGMDEVVQIGRMQGVEGDLTKIKPFPIIVSYLNESNGIVNDIITAKFQNLPRGTESGQMDLTADFNLLCLGIQFDVQN